MNDEEKKRINEIKSELYSRKKKNFLNKRKGLKKNKTNFKSSWGMDSKTNKIDSDLYKYNKRGPSIFSIIFILAIIFFVSALSFAIFYLSFNKNSIKSEVEISLIGPDSVKSGENLEFLVKIINPQKIDYRDIELSLIFPKSTIDGETKDFLKHKDIFISNPLLAGGKLSKKFNIILSGAEGEKRDIEINLYYKVANFSNVLKAKRIYTVKIESAPVSIEMEYPKKVLSKKEYNFDVNILSNSKDILYDLVVIARYPSGFKLIESTPEAVFSNSTQNVFKIKRLAPGEIKKINIKGILSGQEDENKFFSFEIGDSIPFTNEIRTIFAKTENEIAIKKPDLAMTIKGGEEDKDQNIISYAGKDVDLSLILRNSLNSVISNLKMNAFLKGDIFDKKTVKVKNGFYNSMGNKILWDKTTDADFKSISKNSSLEKEFSFKILDLEKLAGYIKDPNLKLNFEVSGTNFEDESSAGKISESFTKNIKIGTNVIFKSNLYYNSGPFKNKGDLRPVVGEPTTYTVAWEIYNSTSDILNTEVRAKLPLYVKFLNNIHPKNSYLSYDPETREVIWKYKKIEAFIGYRTEPKKVYFQIEYIPTAPHSGNILVILHNIKLLTKDSFTEKNILISSPVLKTDIKNDNGYYYGVGFVKDN